MYKLCLSSKLVKLAKLFLYIFFLFGDVRIHVYCTLYSKLWLICNDLSADRQFVLTLMSVAVLWSRSFFLWLWLSGQIVVVITSNALLIKGIHSIGQPEKSYTASKHWPKGSISSTKNCKMPRLLLNICPVSGQNICEQKLYTVQCTCSYTVASAPAVTGSVMRRFNLRLSISSALLCVHIF